MLQLIIEVVDEWSRDEKNIDVDETCKVQLEG